VTQLEQRVGVPPEGGPPPPQPRARAETSGGICIAEELIQHAQKDPQRVNNMVNPSMGANAKHTVGNAKHTVGNAKHTVGNAKHTVGNAAGNANATIVNDISICHRFGDSLKI